MILLYPFFNRSEYDDTSENVVCRRKTINFPFLTNKTATFSKDKNENWTITFEDELILDETTEKNKLISNTKKDFNFINSDENETEIEKKNILNINENKNIEATKNNNNNNNKEIKNGENSITLLKESSSMMIGEAAKISAGKHLIKKFFVRKSVYKSHSLLSLLKIHSPYLIFASSLHIVFHPISIQNEKKENFEPELNSFLLELGGGECRYGSYWIDCALEHFPVFKGKFFENEKVINFFVEAYKQKRLSWEEVRNEFNNFQK